MQPISFKRHRFPPDVIRLAVWLYCRFTLSFRDVEEMLAQRGIEVSDETVRCWALKFGQAFAQNLRRSRPKPTCRWHFDEQTNWLRTERRSGSFTVALEPSPLSSRSRPRLGNGDCSRLSDGSLPAHCAFGDLI